MSLPVSLFLSSVFTLAALGMLADVRSVRPGAVVRGVALLAPVAALVAGAVL